MIDQPNHTLRTIHDDWHAGLAYHRVGSDLCYWLITDNGKIISKTSVEHVTRDDYLQADKRAEIKEFNRRLEESLDDANFVVEGEGEFESMYLDDVEDNENPGIVYANEEYTPTMMICIWMTDLMMMTKRLSTSTLTSS